MKGTNLTNLRLIQYLADGYKVIDISVETGVNKRAIEKRILTLRKASFSKTYAELVAIYLRKKLID